MGFFWILCGCSLWIPEELYLNFFVDSMCFQREFNFSFMCFLLSIWTQWVLSLDHTGTQGFYKKVLCTWVPFSLSTDVPWSPYELLLHSPVGSMWIPLTWVPCEFLLRSTWALLEFHVGSMWVPFEFHVGSMQVPFEFHVGLASASCPVFDPCCSAGSLAICAQPDPPSIPPPPHFVWQDLPTIHQSIIYFFFLSYFPFLSTYWVSITTSNTPGQRFTIQVIVE